MTLPSAALDRFATALDALVPPGARLGLAVSGGADSLALLLLARAARPDSLAAITVDHRLRGDSGMVEAEAVAGLCDRLGVPHDTATLDWPDGPPERNVEASARDARYASIERWADALGLAFVATAHHADDQAETMVMRLARGAGLAGLAGIRATRPLGEVTLVRPLLSWTKGELAWLCGEAGITPFEDPMNSDPRFDRVRVRRALSETGFDDAAMWAASARHLGAAEEALDWTARHLADRHLRKEGDAWVVEAEGLPDELTRRLLLLALDHRGDRAPRGPDLERAMAQLRGGGRCVLGHTLLQAAGDAWSLSDAPPRRSL